MARLRKPKNRKDLFVYVLNKWLDAEMEKLSMWGIGKGDIARIKVKKRYNEFLEMWEKLENEPMDK